MSKRLKNTLYIGRAFALAAAVTAAPLAFGVGEYSGVDANKQTGAVTAVGDGDQVLFRVDSLFSVFNRQHDGYAAHITKLTRTMWGEVVADQGTYFIRDNLMGRDELERIPTFRYASNAEDLVLSGEDFERLKKQASEASSLFSEPDEEHFFGIY